MGRPFFVLVSTLLFGTSTAQDANHHPHRVISLPGAPLHPEFNLFSGFLNGSSNATSIPLFYVLAESIRVDPSTAPLVVWFNGGPGGSSLSGFLKGHGPYQVTEEGDTLAYNEFSWNQYANVLYLESPLGVGFSQNSERDITMNDIDAAEINFNALRDLMTKVHTKYGNQDYYLSGLSYAGTYVPHLAKRLLEGIHSGEMKNGKFKGFSIGNPTILPLYRNESFVLSNAYVLAMAMKQLNYGVMPLKSTEKVLQNWIRYDRGEECNGEDMKEIQMYLSAIRMDIEGNSRLFYNFIEHCYNDQQHSHEKYHVPVEKKSMGCYGRDALKAYVNRADVQDAFHIVNFGMRPRKWSSVNGLMASYYDRSNNVTSIYKDIFRLVNGDDQVLRETGSSFRVLIYNGDTDVMIPPLLTIYGVHQIAMENSFETVISDGTWRFYGDFAGMKSSYRSGNVTMDMLTVRGAGHGVFTELPAQAFQMINNFIFTKDTEEINYSEPIRKK